MVTVGKEEQAMTILMTIAGAGLGGITGAIPGVLAVILAVWLLDSGSWVPLIIAFLGIPVGIIVGAVIGTSIGIARKTSCPCGNRSGLVYVETLGIRLCKRCLSASQS